MSAPVPSPRSRPAQVGQEPCTARAVSISKPTNPLCATRSCSSVGSQTIAASAASCARRARARRARAPRRRRTPTTTSPASRSFASPCGCDERRRHRALHVARAAPVSRPSRLPRLERALHPLPRRPCRGDRSASASRPPPVPRAVAMTFGRPGSTSSTSTSSPVARARRRPLRRPRPPLTRPRTAPG